ncbi:MAG: FAD-dependent oxidoreductase, partial [Chloroflexi bacterium]|nr:FAD-dependent oxidoreductase [Chloroflexota bacterium]
SKHPYIRECRRIKALVNVVEQDVAVAYQPGPRAAHFQDSAGVGWYPIDIHQAGEGDVGASTSTRPFQVPLGALIPVRTQNLIAANKNIGTTHITNGCYRLHPVEWNIGEVAGALASFAIDRGELPRTVHADRDLLRSFQRELVSDGVPLCWLVDVPVWSPDFAAVQRLVVAGGYGGNEGVLEFNPESLIDARERALWITQKTEGAAGPCGSGTVSRGEFARTMAETGLT